MGSLKNIYDGWTKALGFVDVTDNEKDEAQRRVAICIGKDGDKCPYAREQWVMKWIDDILEQDKEGSGIGCAKCGCPVNKKALVASERCPDNRW